MVNPLVALLGCSQTAVPPARIVDPVPHRVFQRDPAGIAEIALRVEGCDGVPEVSLTEQIGLAEVGAVECAVVDGVLTGAVRGVPTGGPYTLRVGETTVPGLLVGDLWVLAGQSNMEGCGKLIDLEPPSPLVNAYYMDDRWANAEEPLHWLLEANAPVHWVDRGDRTTGIPWERAMREQGAGLGLPFAKTLVEATGVPIGLIPSAHGGTSMDQWSPAFRDKGGESFYGATLARIAAVGGRVAGLLWYQGESDAWGLEIAEAYAEKTRGLVAALRADTGIAGLPFLYVQLGRYYNWEAPAELVQGWDIVREAQRTLETELAPAACVPAIDLSLDDAIHVSTPGLRVLGERMAKAALAVVYGSGNGLGPRPEAPIVGADRRTVTIPFTGVSGGLTEKGRVTGFRVLVEGNAVRLDNCRVGEDRESVTFSTEAPIPPGALLHYGPGLNPTCPLHDERGMAVPTFGPFTL